MRHRIFSLATLLSLLLCMATVVLSVNSRWKVRAIGCTLHDHRLGISSTPVGFYLVHISGWTGQGLDYSVETTNPLDWPHGFYVRKGSDVEPGVGLIRIVALSLPYWFVFCVSISLPATWLLRHLRPPTAAFPISLREKRVDRQLPPTGLG